MSDDAVPEIIRAAGERAVAAYQTFFDVIEHGKVLEAVSYQIERLRIPVLPFDAEQAQLAASLCKATRLFGLSLGDRACLCLALKLSVTALTTERDWGKCGLNVEIVNIR
jgi:ribonuclease VapC